MRGTASWDDAMVRARGQADRFARAHRETLDELLDALVSLGQARRTRGAKYTC